jgi:hypothetical protein
MLSTYGSHRAALRDIETNRKDNGVYDGKYRRDVQHWPGSLLLHGDASSFWCRLREPPSLAAQSASRARQLRRFSPNLRASRLCLHRSPR